MEDRDEPSARPTGRPMKEPTNKLSATLRQLRKDAGLSGIDAAKAAELSQSKVSRIETGALAPSPQAVEVLCRVYGAPPAVRRELVGMATELREDRISARLVLERGGWMLQERIGRIEEIAGRIRSISPTVVPGLLQTREYAAALFGEALSTEDRDRTVGARLARQRLLESDRAFDFVLTEGALRWNMGGPAVMVEQLNHLAKASTRENVRIGVVPWTTPVSLPLVHTVDIYDSRAVMFGTISATALITDPATLSEYESHWSELAPFVTYGNAARVELQRITTDYQALL